MANNTNIYSPMIVPTNEQEHGILVKSLPEFIRKDLLAFEKCLNENDELHFDIYWTALSTSINSARHGYDISDEVADYLWYKYIYDKEEEEA
jgi:hypothetical protein